MADKFIIQGGHQINGEVEIRGSKNAAGALISATLLTKEPCILDNIPLVSDILNLLEILEEMGVEIEWLEKRKVKLTAGDKVNQAKINLEKFSRSRVSVLLMGALLARFGEFKVSRPGGDRIGLRPITTHLQALKELGCEIQEQGDFYIFKAKELKGREIILSEFSVTATETLLIASCLANDQTIIKTAAQEPHVQDLILMLNKMGAQIEQGFGHILKINGVSKLKGAEHNIVDDYLEVGTFAVMALATGGKVKIKATVPGQLDLFWEKIREMGGEINFQERFVEVIGQKDFKSIKVQALPHPGFPTDLLPIIVPLLTQATGKSLIHDPLYENRLHYTQELRKMGAEIEIVDPHRAFVFGKTLLKGVSIESWDIRAGAALLLAGLIAEGKTTLKNVEQIDRGYERIEERLQQLGAKIERVSNL